MQHVLELACKRQAIRECVVWGILMTRTTYVAHALTLGARMALICDCVVIFISKSSLVSSPEFSCLLLESEIN